MSIISKETWDKFTQEEKQEVIEVFQMATKNNAQGKVAEIYGGIFPEEALQPQPLTYEDVARELFMGKDCYYTDFGGVIRKTEADYKDYQSAGYCISVKQAKKLLAINKLMNVAKFLNGNWKPDWENIEEKKYCFFINSESNLCISFDLACSSKLVYFRTEELAKQCMAILGEEVIRLALTTEY